MAKESKNEKSSTKKSTVSKKQTSAPKVSKAPRVPKTPKVPMGSDEHGHTDDGKRSFRAIYKTLGGQVVKAGRYCGKKPKQAACKALTAILKLYKEGTGKTYTKKIYFGVVETTRGSRHKHYWYSGERQKVTTVEVVIKDRKDSPIVYRYNNSVMKASEEDCRDLLSEDSVSRLSRNSKTSKKQSLPEVDETPVKPTKKTSKKEAPVKAVVPTPAPAPTKATKAPKSAKPAAKKPAKKGAKKTGK